MADVLHDLAGAGEWLLSNAMYHPKHLPGRLNIKAVSQLMQATYHAIISFVDQDGITELKVQ